MKARNLDKALKLKQKLITRGKGIPGASEGRDGDLTIRVVSGRGIFLFYKWGNKWYSTRMSMYTPKSSESKERVKVPIGVEPTTKGELALTTDNKLVLRKGKTTRNQVASMNSSKKLDISEFEIGEKRAAGDSATTTDVKIRNRTGHANLWLNNTSGNTAYDSYILFTAFSGETHKLWTLGVDSSDTYAFKLDYTSQALAAGLPIPGSATKLTLTNTGALTTAGSITDGSGNTLSAHPVTALNNATANELVTVGATTTELDAEANLMFDGDHLAIAATGRIYFDGGNDTNIYESSADVLRIAVGGDIMMQLSEKGDDGNEINFGSSCAGFTQLEPTYDATSTIVDFRLSNKQFVTFDGGDITNLELRFPLVSGNFVCLIKQDGTGSRTITNYRAMEFDESAADGSAAVKFAGGSNPTLTTDANHVDILSFYWDADNEIAYGVATLDFQF